MIGLTLKLLGITIAEPSQEIWREEVRLTGDDGCEFQ